MKIDEILDKEILGEFSRTDRDIRYELEKQGYKHLGSGVDQTAYIEPDGHTLLKIFGTQGKKFSRDQKLFKAWADFCERNSDNPFLPKYSGWETFEYKGDTYLQIRTEFLKPSGDLGQAIAKLGRDLEWGFADYFSLKSKRPFEYRRVARAIGEEHVPLLINTLLELMHEGHTKKNWDWDLHGGNIMLRSNGQPVLNDPWVIA